MFCGGRCRSALDDGVFVPVGWIKELRRNVLEQLETHLKAQSCKNL